MHLEGLATEFPPFIWKKAVSPGQSCMSLARLESWRMGPSIRKASVRGVTAVKKVVLGRIGMILLGHAAMIYPTYNKITISICIITHYYKKTCSSAFYSEIFECLSVVLLIEHHWTLKILRVNGTRTQSSSWKAPRQCGNGLRSGFSPSEVKSQRLEPHDLQAGNQ